VSICGLVLEGGRTAADVGAEHPSVIAKTADQENVGITGSPLV
jgi:hypothetical protein